VDRVDDDVTAFRGDDQTLRRLACPR
jgi:hypothetical protein